MKRQGLRRRQYRAPRPGDKKKTMTGELRLHRDGYGFVLAASAGEEDVFVPAHSIGDAMHTDLVEVAVIPGRGGKLEGRIVRIVERRVSRLVGRLERHGGAFQVVTDDTRVRRRIIVAPNDCGGAKHGENCIVKILSYSKGGSPMQGEVIERLGERGDPSTEKSAVIARHQLKTEFPRRVIRDADALKEFADDCLCVGREDLRHIPFVTIDGETAKDFDDAVSVERLGSGIIRLRVSIADVANFVRPQSALDSEAFARGTSVYFPGECLPMLPQQLSNNLCSLMPDEDRLTLTCEMDVDQGGNIGRRRFYRSVIKSRERMTYTSVRKILIDRDPETLSRYQNLVGEFKLMEECFQRIRVRRIERGSIDFDLPEPQILIDMQGEITDIVRAERNVAHMIIEEFMIAANESVAEFLSSKGAGCIFRIHEPPPADKLREFSVLLNNLGIKFRADRNATPASLAKVVSMVRGKPEERLVNHMLLRSMSQAVYSSENKGHFGLASSCYCHFTSPIRRYPDLIVHRLLIQALSSKGNVTDKAAKKAHKARLEEIAEHSSRRERLAMEAEREMAKLYAALFMQQHLGSVFDGIISHTAKFGFFVELIDYFVEGVVNLDSMNDDRYSLQEDGMTIRGRRRNRVFKIGDRLHVKVLDVDVPDREVEFQLVKEPL